MPDPLILGLVAIIFSGVAIWQTIIHCADAELHGNRLWWRKASFRAKQRVEYKEFCDGEERNANMETQYTGRE